MWGQQSVTKINVKTSQHMYDSIYGNSYELNFNGNSYELNFNGNSYELNFKLSNNQ